MKLTPQQLMERFEYSLEAHGENEFPMNGCKELLDAVQELGLEHHQREVEVCLYDFIKYAKKHDYPTPGLVDDIRNDLNRILGL